MSSREIWLVAREMGGWAEAGGVKDVVHDQAAAFSKIGWICHVVLPLYGFLNDRVKATGRRIWVGVSAHPTLPVPIEAWVVTTEGFAAVFLDSPAFAAKRSVYTYTSEDEAEDPAHVRGRGFEDGFVMNLEFQWAVASFWAAGTVPDLVLGHDGHTGFVPVIARTHAGFGDRFADTVFGLLVHNAGPGYRQDMPVNAANELSLGLSEAEARFAVLDGHFDPAVSASRHGKLATVSENYADELKTGRNDHWSGGFGPWLRASGTALEGITNGLSTEDKDPRRPEAAGLPTGFDPLRGDWEGKADCRRVLEARLVSHPSVHGGVENWDGVLYVMQGRLTAQKGIDALAGLIERAIHEAPSASFLVMAQGEWVYEERLKRLASAGSGRVLFLNAFEDDLARLVFAAGDFFLMPSEYEPCGLTDLKAQLMGTLPIVHRVGGLVKVIDGVTGFSYNSDSDFWEAFERSLKLWNEDRAAILAMRRLAFVSVLEDFQWTQILEQRYIPWLTGSGPISILSRYHANLAQG